VVRSAKTGEERTVPLPARVTDRFGAGPKWFPDNHSVLVESGDAQGVGFGFYRLTLDTGNTELLAHLPRVVTSYDVSPDGRTIFYAVGGQLLRFDIDSHHETELRNRAVDVFQTGWEVVSLAVSPDGMQLAMTLIGGVVEVMPATGGPSREIFRPAAPEVGTGSLRQALTWTPDQRFLLWVRGDGTFWKVPAPGGEADKVGISVLNIKSPTVHPDGKRLVFSGNATPNPSKVWALENFLPQPAAKK
jgi:Tol biopolymer transport system component